jgi:hypothetical protein
MLDIENETFTQMLQHWEDKDFDEVARKKFISSFIAQVNSGGTTIGLLLDRVGDFPELAPHADRILELRCQEIEGIVLFAKDGVVDLSPLYLTAFGYLILQALEMGLTCTMEEFDLVSQSLEKLDLTIQVAEALSEHTDSSFPSNMSKSLCEYILELVKSKTP